MNVPGKLMNLVALLEDGGLPVKVPDGPVHTAMETRVISVPASRDGAREALGKVPVNEYLVQAAMGALRLSELGEIASAMGDRRTNHEAR